jgi:hypothetical protein
MDMMGAFATHVRRSEFLRSGSNLVPFALAAFVVMSEANRSL